MSERWKLGVYLLFAVVIGLLAISGCETRPQDDELKASLGKVAEEYWNKRFMEGDLRGTYDMEVKEGRPSFAEYAKKTKNQGQIKYLSIKTKEAKVDKDSGVVILTVQHEIPGIPRPKNRKKLKPLVLTITDKWIYTSEGWRHMGVGRN